MSPSLRLSENVVAASAAGLTVAPASAPDADDASRPQPLGRDGGRRTTMLGVLDQGIVSLTNFGTTVFVGKYAGVSDLGVYSLAFTVVLLAMAVQECFVVAPYTIYQVHRRGRAQRVLLGNTILASVLLSGVCVLAVLLAAGAGVGLSAIVGPLALAVPAAMARELVRRVALARLELARTLWIDLAAGVVQIGCLAGWAAVGNVTATAALFSIVGGGLAAAAVWAIPGRRQMQFDRSAWPAHFAEAVQFGKWLCASRVTSVLNNYVVLYLLGLMVGIDAVGGFTAAFVLIAAANPLLMGFTNVLAPRTAMAWADGGAPALRKLVLSATLWLTAVTAAFSAAIALSAGPLLTLLYSPEYAGYTHSAAVLTLTLLVGIVGVPSDHGLRAAQRPKASLTANASGLCVTVLFTLVLVPWTGPVGAAYAMTVGCGVSAVMRCAAFERLTRSPAYGVSAESTVVRS